MTTNSRRFRMAALWSVALLSFAFARGNGWALNLGEESNGKSPSDFVLHMKLSDGTSDRSRHVFQNGINLNPDENYKVTFWARGSTSLKMGVSTKLNAPPWVFFGVRDDVQLTPEWRRYSFNFSAKGAQPGLTRLAFTLRGVESVEVWIGDVELRPQGAAADSENLIANGQFNDGMMQWNLEGKQAGVFEVDVQSLSDANAAAPKN